MQIPSRAGHIALLVILASGGLALGCLVRVSIRQFPLLFLQGTNLLMTFGMSVVLSFWAPTVRVLWSSYLSHMLLVSIACLRCYACTSSAHVRQGALLLTPSRAHSSIRIDSSKPAICATNYTYACMPTGLLATLWSLHDHRAVLCCAVRCCAVLC